MNIKWGTTQYKTLDNHLMAVIEHTDESIGGLHDVSIVNEKGDVIAIYHSFKGKGQI